jgi:Xaa-Pro aminopeptidase
MHPMDRAANRRDQVLAGLAERGANALLVLAEANVRYLTGFTGDSSALILTRDRTLLVSDGRYATQIQEECPGVEPHIRPLGQDLDDGLVEVIGKLGVASLGFESNVLSTARHAELTKRLPRVTLTPLPGRVEALRAVKDDEEIGLIREAVTIAERAFTMLRAGLRLQDSEKDAADDLEHYLRRCGASAASFPPIVAVGPRAALPHARPSSQTRMGDDDFVLVDWGASALSAPYKSDLTRVVVTGKVTPKFETVYRTVLSAQERAIASIRPGVLARDVDAEARSVIEEAGFGAFFQHGLGHGLGLDIHEAPRLRKESDVKLVSGMVVTVEPGIYLPGWGGVRIEDDVLVTPDGCEVLTHVPKSLDSVRVG